MEVVDVQIYTAAAFCSWSKSRAASHLDHTPWLHVFVDWKSDLKMAVTGSGDGF